MYSDKWMSCVDKSSTWIGTAIDVDTNPGSRIKVAIIDDGVDASHEGLSAPIKTGITYCPANRGQPTPSAYYASTNGHGTLMATLIETACPFVEFYIAKLDDSGGRLTPSSAAKVSVCQPVRDAVLMLG
jgi:hypothetical protein